MAKKKKKQNSAKQLKNKHASNPLRQQEEAVRRVYHSYMKDVNKRRAENQRFYGGVDYDTDRVKRRISATTATMEEFKNRFHTACPIPPEGFDFETDWTEANATPRLAYDMEEEYKAGLLGAAIWMLDVIRDHGDTQAVAELLPDHIDPTDVGMPDVWDPCHSEEMLLGMLSILENRNADCVGLKKAEKNTGSPKNRYYLDSYTMENLHKQDVPSRTVFEKILSHIPQAEIDRAVELYMGKYWDVVDRYYKSRVVYAQEEAEICAGIDRYNAHVDSAAIEVVQASYARNPMDVLNMPTVPELVKQYQKLPITLPQGQMSSPLASATQYQNILKTARRLQDEKVDLDARWEEIGDKISGFWCDTSCLLFKPREWIAEQYGEEIADIWAGIEIEDPYALCFAFLYLVDQGSDYPWVYYPGVTLFSMTMDTLPWCRTAYKGDPEGVWDHFDPDTMELVPGPLQAELPKRIKVPELENWNRLQYLDQYEDELGYQEKVSLAQVMYELTGCIMPRNQQRYYPALLDLDAYGITGKKALHPLIYCMNLLGEGKYRSRKLPRMEWDMDEQPVTEQEAGQTESVEEMKAKIAALQSENSRLKQTVYEADRELREVKKINIAQEQKAELDRQELSDLRELVLHLREDVYDGEPENTEIAFPYHNFQRVVVFGGHDSWAREIKPRLPDVRFIDKDMVPNAEVIRRADIVWVQANAISHAYYYKILDETRKHSIPVRYFSYASALKCAEQLAEQDMKEAQK